MNSPANERIGETFLAVTEGAVRYREARWVKALVLLFGDRYHTIVLDGVD
jgi:hypothetical protein